MFGKNRVWKKRPNKITIIIVKKAYAKILAAVIIHALTWQVQGGVGQQVCVQEVRVQEVRVHVLSAEHTQQLVEVFTLLLLGPAPADRKPRQQHRE